MDLITKEETQVATQNGLTEQQYLAMRNKFVIKTKKTWMKHVEITPEDLSVMRSLGVDLDSFKSGKLVTLATNVINLA